MASLDSEFDAEAGDLQDIIAEQRCELAAAKALDSDLEFAFNLQLQEAINASLALHNQPSTSAANVDIQPQLKEEGSTIADILSDDLLKLEEVHKDQADSRRVFKKLKVDFHRRIHDHHVALEISRMPEKEWKNSGDDYERPFGEGSSEGVVNEICRVYFKGLVDEQLPEESLLGGIGVAICDSRDDLLFELRKPLVGSKVSRQIAELRALIDGLNAALELGLTRVAFYCDNHSIFKLVTAQSSAKEGEVSGLINQVSHLKKRFTYCQPFLLARADIKFAFKLAREAIVSLVSKDTESSHSRNSSEPCAICLEDTNISQIFSVYDCSHRYCFSCMKQHVEVLLLHGMLPTCPHAGCKTVLKINSCRNFLTPRLIEIMSQRLKESSIPVTERVYCPYPKCSALMSKGELLQFSESAQSESLRRCTKCNGEFCIDCKVPWHNNMTCLNYKKRNSCSQQEEAKLKNLAATNLWRQCVKCNHMIELAAGCYHMTCRCGYEFCYTCGAEWRNKKATCSCLLWNEENILEDEFEED